MSILTLLKTEVAGLLDEVDEKNFKNYYSLLENKFVEFKRTGGDQVDAEKILNEIYSELNLNDPQEEVFTEIEARVHGSCSEQNRIW